MVNEEYQYLGQKEERKPRNKAGKEWWEMEKNKKSEPGKLWKKDF